MYEPRHFDVVEADQTFFRSWTDYFNIKIGFTKKYFFKIQPICNLKIMKANSRLTPQHILFQSSVVLNRRGKEHEYIENEFELSDHLYKEMLYICRNDCLLKLIANIPLWKADHCHKRTAWNKMI